MVLVSVVFLFFLRETVHTLIRTLLHWYRYPIEGCSPAWRPVAAWIVLSRLVMRAGTCTEERLVLVFFYFQIVDPDPALPVGQDPSPEPDPNRIMIEEKAGSRSGSGPK
jgi:hypothetical protein